MYNVREFVQWALTHAQDGAEPWQYLFGSVRVQTTQATLDYYWENHYKYQKGMTRAKYDALTADWDRTGYATDCQGLLDAYLTYECDEFTDKNANWVYDNWCTDRGRIEDTNRKWEIGEAVFKMNAEGRMTHVGWVCGFEGCEPLIVEARGIAYGVVVTHLYDRDFTHRGLMTKKFDYPEEPTSMTIFEVTKPMQTGEPYAKMQEALNYAGYTDADGNLLEVDGKWGKRSQQAFDAMIADYAADVVPTPAPAPEPVEDVLWEGSHGRIVLEYK